MGVLPHPKLEAFAQQIARGKTCAEAAEIAGYTRGSSFADNARKRSHRLDVKARVTEIITVTGIAETADTAYILRKVVEAIEEPVGPKKMADHLKALDLLAKIKGAYAAEKHDLSFVNHGDKLDAALKRIAGS